jgi:hypothetical protein
MIYLYAIDQSKRIDQLHCVTVSFAICIIFSIFQPLVNLIESLKPEIQDLMENCNSVSSTYAIHYHFRNLMVIVVARFEKY